MTVKHLPEYKEFTTKRPTLKAEVKHVLQEGGK